jgi:hypothetical protein
MLYGLALVSDQIIISIVGLAAIVAQGILLIINTILTNRQARQLNVVSVAVQATKEAMVNLEKNTNSKMDQLIQKTGEAANAEGQLQGASDERIRMLEASMKQT